MYKKCLDNKEDRILTWLNLSKAFDYVFNIILIKRYSFHPTVDYYFFNKETAINESPRILTLFSSYQTSLRIFRFCFKTVIVLLDIHLFLCVKLKKLMKQV